VPYDDVRCRTDCMFEDRDPKIISDQSGPNDSDMLATPRAMTYNKLFFCITHFQYSTYTIVSRDSLQSEECRRQPSNLSREAAPVHLFDTKWMPPPLWSTYVTATTANEKLEAHSQ
jgi:hypothetical protein